MSSRLSQQQRVFVVEHYWQTRNAARVIDACKMNLDIQHHIKKPFTTSETNSIKLALWLTLNVLEDQHQLTQLLMQHLLPHHFKQSPCKSADHLSIELGITHSFVQNILHKNSHWQYHPCLVHRLIEDDPNHQCKCMKLFLS